MTKGEGSLSKLERLKAEYGPRFKAAAPKRRRINEECFKFLCPTAIARVGLSKGGYLQVKKPTCSRKRCPREKVTMRYFWNMITGGLVKTGDEHVIALLLEDGYIEVSREQFAELLEARKAVGCGA